jgi:hypothetical protein
MTAFMTIPSPVEGTSGVLQSMNLTYGQILAAEKNQGVGRARRAAGRSTAGAEIEGGMNDRPGV